MSSLSEPPVCKAVFQDSDLFNLYNNLGKKYNCPHFTDEKTDAQRG